MKRDLPEGVYIAGIDEPLPPGEALLWQGAPRWQALARRALHVNKLALYFAVLIAWRVAASWADGQSVATALAGSVWLVILGAAAVGVLLAIAHGMQRTSIYAITSHRVVLRIGIALPMTLNLPLRQIDAAGLKLHGDGTGDMPLTLNARDRIAWLHLWPHARPWHLARPQPMLRAVAEPLLVADILARALAAHAATTAVPVAAPEQPRTVRHTRALTAQAA